MNIYRIGEYTIVAERPWQAYHIYLCCVDNNENIFDDIDLAPGDESSYTVNIRRLTYDEIRIKNIPCCIDGCDQCGNDGEKKYSSYQELVMQHLDVGWVSPHVLSKEE